MSKNKATLERAFLSVINQRGLLTGLGYTAMTVANLKRNYATGRVSIKRMREVVSDAGYKCSAKETWIKG